MQLKQMVLLIHRVYFEPKISMDNFNFGGSMRHLGSGPRSLIAALIAFSALVGTAVHAADSCPNGQRHATLAGDIEMQCGVTTCLEMDPGLDLNMKGFTVTCLCPTGCGTAVRFSEAGHVVSNGRLDGAQTGTGRFSIGISGAERVLEMEIWGAETGIIGTEVTKIVGNSITACDTCIDVRITSHLTAGARSNYIEPASTGDAIGIRARCASTAGATGCRIDQNFIQNYGIGILGEDEGSNPRPLRYTRNFLGRGLTPSAVPFQIPSWHSGGMVDNLFPGCDWPLAPVSIP